MSASTATIEQRIVQAGMECHRLVQAIHEQLKAHYLRDKEDNLLGLVTAHEAGFIKSLSEPQPAPGLLVNSALIASFGGLHVADGIVTYLGLTFAELIEVNPVLNYCAELLGLGVSITVLKLAILAAIAAIFVGRRSIKSRWGTATLAAAVMFYTGVVVSNVLLVAGL